MKEQRLRSVGQPMPDVEIGIMDERNRIVPPGEEGEIALKGATFMRGYYKVLPERFLDADGFFHTQDGGSIDADGYLHWTGRLSNIIKTGGANVSPVEIEQAQGKHPAGKGALPGGVEHTHLGEDIVMGAVTGAGHGHEEDGVRAFPRRRRDA